MIAVLGVAGGRNKLVTVGSMNRKFSEMLRRHGLYTWGEDLAQAKRHLEILEFLLEVIGRTRDASATSAS